jgi:cell fate regulator YaaT (PSP1 superfamily)
MPTVVGVKVRPLGKVLTFDAADTEPEQGDHVIVSTERGEEIGEVVRPPAQVDDEEVTRTLKPVLRIASDDDLSRVDELLQKEREAMGTYRRLVEEHGLDMKPVGVEYLFDERKIVFYFVAEDRVDFRDLVKDLASEFHARIDMRQIGVRDEARMVGGLGHCGEQLCCVRFGGEFQPVSIRMAKAQDLPLNPLKISGLCGRLMCCLRYEYDAYKDFKSRSPKPGATIDTPQGGARVVGLDAPRELVTLDLDGTRVPFPLDALECAGCESGRPCKMREAAFEEYTSAKAAQLGAGAAVAAATGETDQKPKPKSKRRRRGRGGSSQGGKKGQARDGGQKKDAEGQRSGKKRSSGRKRSGGKPRKDGAAKGDGQQRSQGSGGSGGQKGQSSGGQKGQSSGGGSSQRPSSGSSSRRRRRRRPSGGSDKGSSSDKS